MASNDGEQEQSWPVELYVYDLSHGLARQLSASLLGRSFDAIYHTSVVVHGREHFFGQGISITSPGGSHHGHPEEKIDMGRTQIDPETWSSLLEDLRERYRASDYHLLDYNCNTFTNECCQILVGKEIPERISTLPREFLATPLGQMMRPSIDAMFRGPAPVGGARATAPAAAGTSGAAAASLLGAVANEAYAGNTPSDQPVATAVADADKKLAAASGVANGSAKANGSAAGSSAAASELHAHSKIELRTAKESGSVWTTPSTFPAKLNYRVVLSRIDAAIAACPEAASSFAIKAELQDAGRVYRAQVVPALERAAFASGSPAALLTPEIMAELQRANAIFAKHLAATALFPFVELLRAAAQLSPDARIWAAPGAGTSVASGIVFGKQLEELASAQLEAEPSAAASPSKGDKIVQSAYHVLANSFSHASSSKSGTAPAASSMAAASAFINEGLLAKPLVVRTAAASAAWNLCLASASSSPAGASHSMPDGAAPDGLCAALVEAVQRSAAALLASASDADAADAQLLALQLRTLLRLLYKNSAWDDALAQVVQVLDLPDTLEKHVKPAAAKLPQAELRTEIERAIDDLKTLLL